ncbi:MAG TPA: alpha/beta fold hydrolase [Acidimicrobiia bacterium]|nr:alpha/beta fold hydrolase [Acidimicrobiia bacterium]
MSRPRVVLIPGFTQTARSWAGAAGVVGETCDVRALDVPEPTTFVATAAAIGTAGGRAIYAGYSMGGRLCLRLAIDRPELVRGLVLVSASPGIADDRERAARVEADEARAESIERDGVEAFLSRWLAQPMFATVPADAPGLSDRRRLTVAYLAASLRRLGAGAMEPMWNDLPTLTMPVLLVTGTLDDKYTTIARAMLERMHPGVEHVQLQGGHALPLEQPAVLAGLISAFAAEHGPA